MPISRKRSTVRLQVCGSRGKDRVARLRRVFLCTRRFTIRSWNACAAKMYVHVNTVRYRIRRIEELTGRDLSCLDDQVNFFLALRIR